MAANYYELLEVPRDAPSSQIEQAFKQRVKQAHPDQGGSKEEMQRLQKARETLTTRQSRDLYDNLGHYEYVQRYDGPVLNSTPNRQQAQERSTTSANQNTQSHQQHSGSNRHHSSRQAQGRQANANGTTNPSDYTFVDHGRDDTINTDGNEQSQQGKGDETKDEGASLTSQVRGAAAGLFIISILFSIPSALYLGTNFPLIYYLAGENPIMLTGGLALLYLTLSALYLKYRLRTHRYTASA